MNKKGIPTETSSNKTDFWTVSLKKKKKKKKKKKR